MLQALGLEKYVSEPVEADRNELKALDELLESLPEKTFAVEEHPITLLKEQKALLAYSKISPEFLSLNIEKVVQYEAGFLGNRRQFETINIPKFGVYRLNDSNMMINMGKSYEGSVYKKECDYFFEIASPITLPDSLGRNLAKSSGLFLEEPRRRKYAEHGDINRVYGSSKLNTEREIKDKLGKTGPISLKSTFHGIFPEETRKRLLEARKVFGNQIFIVAETKPEDWSQEKYIPRLVKDPLLVGVINDNCFYITEFNTTPLERYVRTEFT